MNIPVLTYSGKVVVRPDTTWKRGDDAFYAPEFVDRVSWTPVVYAAVSRPGRSVGLRFAGRYYDGIGFGLLLYPENLIDGSPEGFASASCIDHTSFLCHPAFPLAEAAGEDARFVLECGGKTIFDAAASELRTRLDGAVAEVSRFCYLRNGDFLAVELAPRLPLCNVGDGTLEISGTFRNRPVLDFKVVI